MVLFVFKHYTRWNVKDFLEIFTLVTFGIEMVQTYYQILKSAEALSPN